MKIRHQCSFKKTEQLSEPGVIVLQTGFIVQTNIMKSIDHLPDSEKQHFIQCSLCDEYYDMRDLGQVFEHEHTSMDKPE